MKILLLSLLFLSDAALAQRWEAVSVAVDGTIRFVDKDSVRRSGSNRRWWLLSNYSSRENGAMSSKMLFDGDCKDKKIKLLQLTTFDGPKGLGDVVQTFTYSDSSAWDYVEPGSASDAVLKWVCSR